MSNQHPDQGSSSSLPAPWQWLRDQEPEPGQHCEWVLLAPRGAKQDQGTWTVIDGAGEPYVYTQPQVPVRGKGFSSDKGLMISDTSITAWRAVVDKSSAAQHPDQGSSALAQPLPIPGDNQQ